MKYEITGKPSYSLLVVTIEPGERIVAESGAMVSMTENIKMTTEVEGGVFGALKKSMQEGKEFFLNSFIAEKSEGRVTLAPPMPGDIESEELSGEVFFVQSSSFLASSPEIGVDIAWDGAGAFFSNKDLLLVKAKGTGMLFFSSYGAIQKMELESGEKYIVDTGHIVAFDEQLKYKIRKAGSLKSLFFSGEGLVCELSGPGTVYIQTRSEEALVSWLSSRLPERG